jgi:hypothetical protein
MIAKAAPIIMLIMIKQPRSATKREAERINGDLVIQSVHEGMAE